MLSYTVIFNNYRTINGNIYKKTRVKTWASLFFKVYLIM